jgi:hypothetical protein
MSNGIMPYIFIKNITKKYDSKIKKLRNPMENSN